VVVRAAVALLAALAVAHPAAAASGFTPRLGDPELSEQEAIAIFLVDPKVADWLERYPPNRSSDASFERETRRWRVHVWSGEAGEVATGRVDDATGEVVEAWTGPQVAWKMARGAKGSFGGKVLNRPLVWIGFCVMFVAGLADLRRPLSLRNLDLLALLSFSVSLAFFNRGEIFRSVPLAYPPLVYLLARMLWVGLRRRALPSWRPLWPVWVLAAAAVFLAGFRIGLNVQAPRSVIDVGYAGVIGADRILDGEAPYGHMPLRDALRACGKADADGDIRERIQTNGRCESANERGDTYGPTAYLAYVPATLTLGWSGRWDALPAAHATSIAFDLLTLVGLVLVGRRFGGNRLAAGLAFAWAAYPFTAYALNANTNDTIAPALLVWGFWLASSPWARGAATATAGWTKFAALLIVPLWAAYPDAWRPRSLARFAGGFALATLAAFSMLLLEPSLFDAVRTFGERTLGFQLDRESPFSLWGWGQYRAKGIPDLAAVQRVLQVGVVALALAVAVVPRTKGPRELAALTAAVLLALELVLTHWFYLYLPWVLPFVLLALLLPREARAGSA
jgi:hypothetical protein